MKKTSKQLSRRQEAEIAHDLGGRVMPASGARWGARRDIKSDAWLVEAKTTGQGSHVVNNRDLAYLTRQAYQLGKTPAYIVEFQGEGSIAIVPRDVFPDDRAGIVADMTRRAGWAFSYIEAYSLVCPLTVQFDCGYYAVITYEEFLAIPAE